ncbi:hypothetical protein LSCM4_06984 [Leishmania orientalis]|uniref:Cytochrome b5 heme-binding domain-containing protein n=1 Tax=Leishmania orientalis TaxID=2249476 RepID=A0A836HD35_9TRYP|nr:hypothetical protein LSCM4_06984 [Leishmania orientalis]
MPENVSSDIALALLLLLVATTCGIMWSCDMCGLSHGKRLLVPSDRPRREAPRAAVKGSPPSPRNETLTTRLSDGPHGAVAAKANKYVVEFYEAAGHWPCPQLQRYTQEEVSRHTAKDDLWIVVNDSVLNVSAFVPHHPGGDVLLDGAGGQDMATVFAYFHHPSTVRLFADFCIGRMLLE